MADSIPVIHRNGTFVATLAEGRELRWQRLYGLSASNGYVIVLAHTDKPLAKLLEGEIAYTLTGSMNIVTTRPILHTWWAIRDARIALDTDGDVSLLQKPNLGTYRYTLYTFENGDVVESEYIEATSVMDLIRVARTTYQHIPIAEFNLNKLPR